jgi:protocatechuate 3,4-dioxygenase, beta subunit
MTEKTTRRAVVTSGVAAGIAGLALAGGAGRALAELVATPRQTSGPFYPVELPLDADNDLVRVSGRPNEAAGQVVHLFGRVLDPGGRAIAGAEVQIWQCDAQGYYHHPRDRGDRADPNFQGFGAARTGADGGYRFRTIRPVAYPGRTPHIHFAVLGADFNALVTQMYLRGEPMNERDGVFRAIRDPDQRDSVLVALAPAPDVEAGAEAGTFDLVIGKSLFKA